MSSASKIEWCDATWNPMSGCSKVSAGCANCYAERMAKRQQAMGTKGYEQGFKVTLHPDRLEQPLRWRKPRMVFVCSMGDLFHEDVPFAFVDKVFAVMALCPQHAFQLLTKRPERMAEYIEDRGECVRKDGILGDNPIGWHIDGPYGMLLSEVKNKPGGNENWRWLREEMDYHDPGRVAVAGYWDWIGDGVGNRLIDWPLPNVWLGTSTENQLTFGERVPHLRKCPAAVRFLSCEPLLYRIKCDGQLDDIQWLIVGGETGPHARGMDSAHVRPIRDECQKAGVPFFFKGWGGTRKRLGNRLLDGQEWNEMPAAKGVDHA